MEINSVLFRLKWRLFLYFLLTLLAMLKVRLEKCQSVQIFKSLNFIFDIFICWDTFRLPWWWAVNALGRCFYWLLTNDLLLISFINLINCNLMSLFSYHFLQLWINLVHLTFFDSPHQFFLHKLHCFISPCFL